MKATLLVAALSAVLAFSGSPAWSKHATPFPTETPDAGDFVQQRKTLSVAEQLTELEMIVFCQKFQDDPMEARADKLTHELLPAQEKVIDALSLEEQVGRLWHALKASPKYGANVASLPQPQSDSTGGADHSANFQTAAPSTAFVPMPSNNVFRGPQVDFNAGHPDLQLNRRIMAFAAQHFGQQVGNGECWTLAADAVEAAGGISPQGYVFGRELSRGEQWWPGDIIQFSQCKFKETLPGNRHLIIEAGAPNHTAIYGGQENGASMIAQQNYNGQKRVAVMYLDLSSLVSGSYTVYRPLIQ